MHIWWNVIFFAGAILMYQVVVSCSCFQLLHGQPTTTCSKKKNIGLLEKQGFFFPQQCCCRLYPWQSISFISPPCCFFLPALLEMPVDCRKQGQGQGPRRLGCVQICMGSSCSFFLSMSFWKKTFYILLVMTLNALSFYLSVFLNLSTEAKGLQPPVCQVKAVSCVRALKVHDA